MKKDTPELRGYYYLEEFIERFGNGKKYRISNIEYLRQCCAGVEIIGRGGYRTKRILPSGWKSVIRIKDNKEVWTLEPAETDYTNPFSSKAEERRLVAAERKKKAFAMRKAGASNKEIAEKLGITESGVSRIFSRIEAKVKNVGKNKSIHAKRKNR